MARKNKAPKAPKVKKERKKLSFNWYDKNVQTALIAAVLVICVFAAGNVTGTLLSVGDSIQNAQVDASTEATTAAPQTTAPTTAAPQTTAPTTQAPTAAAPQTTAPAATTYPFESNPVHTEPAINGGSSSAAPSAPAGTTAPAGTQDTTAAPVQSAPAGAPASTEEIIALFNKSADNVKVNATVVQRNFKKQQHLEDKTELPSVLQSVANPLISKLLTDNNEIKVHDTKERIIEKFPVGNETWSSKATAADLKEATCTDDGTSYNITLKYVDGENPVGTGVANSFTMFKVEDIKESAGSLVKNASFSYFDAVITCKIDKATGNMTWINYHLPCVMTVETPVASGKVGLMIEEDFTITY